MILDSILSRLRISRLRWHDLRDVRPVSNKFGFDRGTPIDRYYIQQFLAANRDHIRGTVLEVADSGFSKKYGTDVTAYEVLHVEPHKGATIIGDLSKHNELPAAVADCFICTQVLNFIYPFNAAIEGAFKLLKPGGVMLTTVGGISQVSRFDADRWGHFWSFYPQGIDRAFKAVFGDDNVRTAQHGNSLSAISFIKGIAAEELSNAELDFFDADYPVTITIIATKK
ncbi:MAG: class I SAM-dependent methyltransferase [Bacteroidia bacterium]|nr:class I SAM-dependent methyltransferase [Bacteroidia bacterium]